MYRITYYIHIIYIIYIIYIYIYIYIYISLSPGRERCAARSVSRSLSRAVALVDPRPAQRGDAPARARPRRSARLQRRRARRRRRRDDRGPSISSPLAAAARPPSFSTHTASPPRPLRAVVSCCCPRRRGRATTRVRRAAARGDGDECDPPWRRAAPTGPPANPTPHTEKRRVVSRALAKQRASRSLVSLARRRLEPPIPRVSRARSPKRAPVSRSCVPSPARRPNIKHRNIET